MRLATLWWPFLVAACAVPPPPSLRALPPDEAALVSRASEAVARQVPEAGALVAELLERHPRSVDGARLLQNLRLARGESWELFEAALADAEMQPEDPVPLYLLARLIPDRSVQRDLFLRCLDMDPSFFFGHHGLAVALLEGGDPSGAVEACRRALVVRPGQVDARSILALALERSERGEEAEEIYRELLREYPDRPHIVRAAAERLSRSGRKAKALEALLAGIERTPNSDSLLLAAVRLLPRAGAKEEMLERVVRVAAKAASVRPRRGLARALRGLAYMRLGDARGGLTELSAATKLGAPAARLSEAMIECAVRCGEYGTARGIWEGRLPMEFLARPSNTRWPAVTRLRSALGDISGALPDVRGRAELARALSGAGFDDLALREAERALRESAGNPGLRVPGLGDLVADLSAWHGFLEGVRAAVGGVYAGRRRGEEGPDLAEMIAALGALSVEHLGRDVLETVPRSTYPFVGAVMRTDAEGAPPDWERHGTLLVLGQRASGPVEGTLLRLVGHFRGLTEEGVEYDLAVGEGQSLRSYQEQVSSRIAGFTLPGWIVMNLDVVNRWEERLRKLARAARERPLWPSRDEKRRRSLWFPAGVSARLARRHYAEPPPADASFLSSLAHERGHVVDLDGYYPFVPHLPRILLALVGCGFSPECLGVELEFVAEGWSLRTSSSRRNALLNTIGFLPYGADRPPHSLAYYDLVTRLIRTLDREPERFPSVDRRFNLLQQLDRLTDEELRYLIDAALN